MEPQLFRHEALAARGSQWAGSIVLRRPVPMRVAATVSVAIAIALACYLSIGEYTRKIRVSGQLVPAAGTIKAVAPQFGRVVSRRVNEGDQVEAGRSSTSATPWAAASTPSLPLAAKVARRRARNELCSTQVNSEHQCEKLRMRECHP